MKSILLKSFLCAGVIGVLPLPGTAASLNRADVAGDAKWLLHLDFDALRPTTIGQYILSEMDKPENKGKVSAFQNLFNFDLRTQLHGVTLYGTSAVPESSVLICYADFDAEHLATLAEGANDSQNSQHGNDTIYNWIDDKRMPKDGVQPRIYAAIQGNHVIFGQREESVAHALDVAGKSQPSLAAGNAFPELGLPDKAHFVEAAALKMDLPDYLPNAAIFKTLQSAQLVMGEQRKQFDGALTFVADSAASSNILSIAQGLVAMAKLQAGEPDSENAAKAKVASAITLKQDGERVTLNLGLPAGDIVEMLKADAARKAAKAATAEEKE